ncbi:hypothetical protein RSAG8_05963, partial [Rhizoctonia solani AG-8 WAC10335]
MKSCLVYLDRPCLGYCVRRCIFKEPLIRLVAPVHVDPRNGRAVIEAGYPSS